MAPNASQGSHVAHIGPAGVELAPAVSRPTPTLATPGLPFRDGHVSVDTQVADAVADLPPTVLPPSPTDNASADSLTPGQVLHDAHLSLAGVPLPPARCCTTPDTLSAGAPHDALLLILADAVDDLERARIATANRLRALTDDKGLGGSREQQRIAHMLEQIEHLEHQATLDLKRAMRNHPLGGWVKRTVGIGEKQAARLLAAIGDPADRPNPAKLWQYAGHGDPARSRRRKGEKTQYSPTAKMRLHLIAESCIKQMHSPFREVYDRERARWADRETSDMHKHNHALRVVGKAILLDLWREAREVAG